MTTNVSEIEARLRYRDYITGDYWVVLNIAKSMVNDDQIVVCRRDFPKKEHMSYWIPLDKFCEIFTADTFTSL